MIGQILRPRWSPLFFVLVYKNLSFAVIMLVIERNVNGIENLPGSCETYDQYMLAALHSQKSSESFFFFSHFCSASTRRRASTRSLKIYDNENTQPQWKTSISLCENKHTTVWSGFPSETENTPNKCVVNQQRECQYAHKNVRALGLYVTDFHLQVRFHLFYLSILLSVFVATDRTE